MEKLEQWYAVYTKARWEKKIALLLQERSVQAYCPLNKVERTWSDRKKIIEEPLFKSYVFVKINPDEGESVKAIPGVVNFVYWNGKPAVIRETEIDSIKKFLNEYDHVVAEHLKLTRNQRVKIMNGLWMHEEGVVVKAEKHKVQIYLETLGFILTASLRENEIQVI